LITLGRDLKTTARFAQRAGALVSLSGFVCVGSHNATLSEIIAGVLETLVVTPFLWRLAADFGPSIETVTPLGHDVSMTQLFDTETYEDIHAATGTVEAGPSIRRHLRSIPAGQDLAERTTQWRLDEATIERGRKGIEEARQALQAAARDNKTEKPRRKAA